MKNLYLFLSFLMIGFSAKALPATVENFDRPGYGDAFIFVERGVEFAVFPDGQFDFFFNPRGNFNHMPSHLNYSFNSGYQYGPFIQYDDFGAVIQIENVPVYYDYYGRIIQAGRVRIGYNALGMVNRIGNMFLHYNHYNHFTHTSGFINSRNAHYVYRPWHDYYMRPQSYAVVYHEPYRLYYTPNRMRYNQYKRYYYDHYDNGSFQKNYYRPGEKVTTYHRGRRTDAPREVRRQVTPSRDAVTRRSQGDFNSQMERRDLPVQRAESSTRSSRIEDHVNRRATEPRTQTSRVEKVPAQRAIESQRRTVKPEPASAQRVERTARAQQRNINMSTSPGREIQAESRQIQTPAEANTAPRERIPGSVSARGTRSSRGGQ